MCVIQRTCIQACCAALSPVKRKRCDRFYVVYARVSIQQRCANDKQKSRVNHDIYVHHVRCELRWTTNNGDDENSARLYRLYIKLLT